MLRPLCINRTEVLGVTLTQILQFRGSTSAFLQPPVGKASLELLKMAREGLKVPLRSLVHQAKAKDNVVRKERIQLRHDGLVRQVNLEVIPLKNLKERY